MFEVSTFRLYLLRAMYLFMAVGLAITKLGAGAAFSATVCERTPTTASSR